MIANGMRGFDNAMMLAEAKTACLFDDAMMMMMMMMIALLHPLLTHKIVSPN
jgi:hypothetical protein